MSQQINLLLPELRPRVDWLSLPLVAALAAGLLLLAVLVGQFQAVRESRLNAEVAAVNGELLNLQQQVQTLGQAVAARQPNAALPEEIAALRSGLQQRREVLAYVGRDGEATAPLYSARLQGFARQAMDGLWLIGFGLAPEAVEIRGRLLQPHLLPRYIGRLNTDEAFAGLRFSALEMSDVDPSSASTAGQQSGPRPPRHTEFVLRSAALAPAEVRQ